MMSWSLSPYISTYLYKGSLCRGVRVCQASCARLVSKITLYSRALVSLSVLDLSASLRWVLSNTMLLHWWFHHAPTLMKPWPYPWKRSLLIVVLLCTSGSEETRKDSKLLHCWTSVNLLQWQRDNKETRLLLGSLESNRLISLVQYLTPNLFVV